MIRRIKLYSSFPSNFQEEIALGIKEGIMKPLKVWYQKQMQNALVVPYQTDEVLVVLDQYPSMYLDDDLDVDDDDSDDDYDDMDEMEDDDKFDDE